MFYESNNENLSTEDETYIIMTDDDADNHDDDDNDDDDDFDENQENYFMQKIKPKNNHNLACQHLDLLLAKDFSQPSRQQITPQQVLSVSNQSHFINNNDTIQTSRTIFSNSSSLRQMNINEDLLSSDTKTNDSGFHR